MRYATSVSARILRKWIVLITPLREAVGFVADRITTLLAGEIDVAYDFDEYQPRRRIYIEHERR